jgi:hypothetical protein
MYGSSMTRMTGAVIDFNPTECISAGNLERRQRAAGRAVDEDSEVEVFYSGTLNLPLKCHVSFFSFCLSLDFGGRILLSIHPLVYHRSLLR